jgi:glycerophosphoryl diester phosphodiesterase
MPRELQVKVYGHRAAAGESPENTIAGCRHAIERGARYLELDLRLSADDKLVVIHDRKVNRTTDKRGAVDRYTASTLAAMDARQSGPPWPRKKDAGVPTLDAVLAATPEIKGYYLEVKSGPERNTQLMAELLAERFASRAAAKKVVVTCMNPNLHYYLRERAPHIPLGLISLRPDAVRELEEFDYQQLILPWGVCNPLLIRRAHKCDVEVAVWTVNDPQLVRNMYRIKVDSIITDYPSMALPMVASLMRQGNGR